MKLSDLADFLTSMVFPVIALGVMFLFVSDFLWTLYTAGHVDESLEKEVIGLIGFILGHWITSKSPTAPKS